MEKRIGAILILIEDKDQVHRLNDLLSRHSSLILARQGLPLRDRQLNIISLVIEGSTDEMSALTGPLGKLPGVQIKSMVAKAGSII